MLTISIMPSRRPSVFQSTAPIASSWFSTPDEDQEPGAQQRDDRAVELVAHDDDVRQDEERRRHPQRRQAEDQRRGVRRRHLRHCSPGHERGQEVARRHHADQASAGAIRRPGRCSRPGAGAARSRAAACPRGRRDGARRRIRAPAGRRSRPSSRATPRASPTRTRDRACRGRSAPPWAAATHTALPA